MKLLTLSVILSATCAVTGEIIFTDYDAGSCAPGTAIGAYSYCCFNDNCYIPQYTENSYRCDWQWNIDEDCLDIPYEDRPSCTTNQYYSWSRYGSVPSELGTCVSSDGRTCDLRKKEYYYSCCQCPEGYLSTRTRCGDNGDIRGRCMACSDPKEVLDLDSHTCSIPQPTVRGLTCDLVDNLARQFEITSDKAPITNGYYRQILNLACLRSECEHKSCVAVRRFASKSKECKDLEGSFAFEQSVFAQFATPPNEPELRALVGEIQKLEETIEDWFLKPVENNPALNPAFRVAMYAARRLGPLDPKSIASAIAGYLHFQNDLAASFSAYINGVVFPSCNYDDYDLHSRLEELTLEHDRLFKCAVDVGFTAEVAFQDLTPVGAAVAKIIVPIAAAALRSVDIAVAQLCIGVPNPNIEKRQVDPVTKVEDYFESVGAVLPVTPSLRHDVRNWDQIPYAVGLGPASDPGVSIIKKELPGTQNASLSAQLLSRCQLDIPKRDEDLEPFVIELSLSYAEQTPPTAPFTFNVAGKQIALIGPVASIRSPASEVIPINATYVFGHNFYDPPGLFKDAIAAIAGPPRPPSDDDKSLMYRNAKLSLSYVSSYTEGSPAINPANDITVFDLLNGLPLSNVSFTATSNGSIFEVPLNLNNGIYGGQWSGGGVFALGLSNGSSTESSTTASTSATSSGGASSATSSTASTTSVLTSSSTTPVITSSPSSEGASSTAVSSSRRPCRRRNQ